MTSMLVEQNTVEPRQVGCLPVVDCNVSFSGWQNSRKCSHSRGSVSARSAIRLAETELGITKLRL